MFTNDGQSGTHAGAIRPDLRHERSLAQRESLAFFPVGVIPACFELASTFSHQPLPLRAAVVLVSISLDTGSPAESRAFLAHGFHMSNRHLSIFSATRRHMPLSSAAQASSSIASRVRLLWRSPCLNRLVTGIPKAASRLGLGFKLGVGRATWAVAFRRMRVKCHCDWPIQSSEPSCQ